MIDRTPPFSSEAEQSILGGILLDTAAMDRVSDIVTEADFYLHAHRLIFRAASRLYAAGKPVDVQTIGHELGGEMEAAGGFAYLGIILQNVPSAANVRHYAQIVRDKRIERDLIAASMELADLAYGAAPLSERLDRAQALVIALSETSVRKEAQQIRGPLARVIDDIEKRFNSDGEITGLPTSLIDLDKKTAGLHPGNLVIIAGRPSMGKSLLAQQMAVHAALHRTPAVMFSLEMSIEECAERALVATGKLDGERIRTGRGITPDDFEAIAAGLGRLADIPLYIDDTADATVPQIRAKARRLKRMHNIGLIVVDYLQLMSGSGDSRREQVDEISRGLKLLAKELKIPVIALSQLSRKCEERTNKRPMLSDLRESGSVEQDADVVLFLYRDEIYNPASTDAGMVEINVAKQRMGPTGTIGATWLGSHYSIADHEGHFIPEAFRPKTTGRRSLMAEAGL